MWILAEALPLIQKISQVARDCGFSVALYGSVLDSGKSEKDLDLFFVGQCPDCDVERCRREVRQLPEVAGFGHCAIRLKDGRHIDAQFLLECRRA